MTPLKQQISLIPFSIEHTGTGTYSMHHAVMRVCISHRLSIVPKTGFLGFWG